jgi:hypothetical protein
MRYKSTSVLPGSGTRRLTAVHPDLIVRMPSTMFFGPEHPLAAVAAQRCQASGHDATGHLGGTACGPCWEAAIRTDERVVVECDLDDAEPIGADFIDEVAVELALADLPVPLTAAEQDVVFTRLYGTPRAAAVSCPRCTAQVGLSARGGEQRLMCGSCDSSFLSGDATVWTVAS